MESPVLEAMYPKNGLCCFAWGAFVWDFFLPIGTFFFFVPIKFQNLFFAIFGDEFW